MTGVPKQNLKSKALPGKDGKPRDTSPRGFKQRSTSLGQGPKRVAHVEELRDEVLEQQDGPRPVYRADGFVRATDLSGVEVSRHRRLPMAEGPLSPGEWHARVVAAHELTCPLSGLRSPFPDHSQWDAHHILPQALLKKRGLQGWLWDPRLGVYLVEIAHDWFHDGTDHVLPRNVLPWDMALEAAGEIDEYLGGGTSWATTYLEDRYPLVSDAELARLRAEALEIARERGVPMNGGRR